ncbi:MAG TPA: efflux RND transporter periplasmic adaptor subunit [Candidatus Acidoferrales bacterium]
MAKPKRKRRGVLIGLVVFAAVASLAASALLRNSTKIDPSKLATVERGDVARSVVATGKIEPLSKVQIKSKASGIVKTLYVNVGDSVRSGQVLAELDKEILVAQVREAKANLEAAEANLAAAQATYERNKVDAEGPDVPFLQKHLDRSRKLFTDGLIPLQSLDDAEKNYQLARNKQQSAITNLSVNRAEIQKAAALVAQARATLERADEDLRKSTIVAPIVGVLLSRDVEVGDAVSSILVLGSAATLMMTLGDVREVYVKGKVDEVDVAKIYLGQPARITLESFKDKKYSGKVTRISPMGIEKDNVTTFEVRCSIQNLDGELKTMMTANAEIILEEHKAVLTIPEGAVIYDKDRKTSVEVPEPSLKNGKRKLAVAIGISNGARAEVLSGLKEGQQVVLQ